MAFIPPVIAFCPRSSQSAIEVSPYQAVVSISPRPTVRSAYMLAKVSATQPPIDAPPIIAVSQPALSRTEARSVANNSTLYGPGGLSDKPCPRQSIASTSKSGPIAFAVASQKSAVIANECTSTSFFVAVPADQIK